LEVLRIERLLECCAPALAADFYVLGLHVG